MTTASLYRLALLCGFVHLTRHLCGGTQAHYVATGIVQDYFSMEESRDRAAAMALRALLEAAQAGVFSEGSM